MIVCVFVYLLYKGISVLLFIINKLNLNIRLDQLDKSFALAEDVSFVFFQRLQITVNFKVSMKYWVRVTNNFSLLITKPIAFNDQQLVIYF